MRILMVCEHYPMLGSRAVQSLVHNLSLLGHEVIIVSTNVDLSGKPIIDAHSNSARPIRLVSAKIPRVPYLFTFGARRKLLALLDKYSPDIIHSHFLMYWLPLMSYPPRRCRIPLVVTLHGLTFPSEAKSPITMFFLQFIYLLFARRLLRKASRIICVSCDTKRRLEKVFPRQASKTSVIPNGIDPMIETQRTMLSKHEARDSLQLGNKLTFLYIGRITIDKGVVALVRAFKQFNVKYQNSCLLVVGEGPELAKLVLDCQGNQNIHFLGYRHDVGTFYQASDVAILPSSREGMSTFVIEAMFHGLPIISTNVGGIEDLQQKGAKIEILHSASTDEIYRALEKFVLLSAENRLALGDSNKRAILNNFLWQSLSLQTVAVYEYAKDMEKTKYK